MALRFRDDDLDVMLFVRGPAVDRGGGGVDSARARSGTVGVAERALDGIAAVDRNVTFAGAFPRRESCEPAAYGGGAGARRGREALGVDDDDGVFHVADGEDLVDAAGGIGEFVAFKDAREVGATVEDNRPRVGTAYVGSSYGDSGHRANRVFVDADRMAQGDAAIRDNKRFIERPFFEMIAGRVFKEAFNEG